MPAGLKIFSAILIAIMAIFLFLPKNVFAQIVINKFSSDNDTDWVEVCNTGAETVDLAANNYQLRDTSSSGNPQNLNCLLPASGCYSVDWGNSLNKDGDRINLVRGEEVVDCVAYGDGNGVFCQGESQANLEKLSSGEYGEREPAGTGSWVKTTDSAKAGDAACLVSSPMPTIFPSPSPFPISSNRATYKINEVKDENGEALSSVKIYLDGAYLHHYAPETLTFCDGCQCDTYVSCGFGGHTIRLEKNDYQDWSETRTVSAGDFYEVNPIMNSSDADDSSDSDSDSSSSSSPSPSPIVFTPSPKAVKVTGASLLGKILGEESTAGGFFPWEATEEAEEQEATPSGKLKFLPLVFLGLGLVFSLMAISRLCYTQRGKIKWRKPKN